MALSDVAVTHVAHWMLCVGAVVSDLKPSEEGLGMNQIIRKFCFLPAPIDVHVNPHILCSVYSLRTCTVEK